MPRKTVTSSQEDLEELAVNTMMEVMGNTQYSPETRLAAAEKALRSLGKAEPAKQQNPQIVMNFGDQLSKSLLGMGKMLELSEPRVAEEQESRRV